MKNIFWLTVFICFMYIITINSIPRSKAKLNSNDLNDQTFLETKVMLNTKELMNIFKKSEVSLISAKACSPLYNKSIRLEGENINTAFTSLLEKFSKELILKGYEEQAINYKVNGFNVCEIKIFGKNKDILELLKELNIN